MVQHQRILFVCKFIVQTRAYTSVPHPRVIHQRTPPMRREHTPVYYRQAKASTSVQEAGESIHQCTRGGTTTPILSAWQHVINHDILPAAPFVKSHSVHAVLLTGRSVVDEEACEKLWSCGKRAHSPQEPAVRQCALPENKLVSNDLIGGAHTPKSRLRSRDTSSFDSYQALHCQQSSASAELSINRVAHKSRNTSSSDLVEGPPQEELLSISRSLHP